MPPLLSLFRSKLFVENERRLVHHIYIVLCRDLVRRVHRKQGNSDIDVFDILVRKELRDGAAASLVDFSEFSELVNDVVFVKERAKFSDELRRSLGRTRFASCARKLADRTAFVQICDVVFLKRR